MPQILVIDDRAEIRLSLNELLTDHDYKVLEAETPLLAQRLLARLKVDLILLDMNFSRDTTSGKEGLDFLRWIQQQPDMFPVVVMTAWSTVDLAVQAMQLGACDFIEKPWKNKRLLQVVQNQLSFQQLQTQNRQLKQQLSAEHEPAYHWRSPCMQKLMRQLETVATTDANLLLTGANGTGKSELARQVHQWSLRKDEALISVNMGAIPESLFESELFGHTKGAFTDAKQDRVGRFELAEKGSLFLDEIGNISLPQQAKLLRVLESSEYEVLGSSQTRCSNVRLICATNADLPALIASGDFREDLYYRLNTLEFRLPSLAERQQDIVPLAEHLIAYLAQKYQKPKPTLTTEAGQALLTYHWPGNIRELAHLLERAVLLLDADQLTADRLNLQSATAQYDLPLMPLAKAEEQLVRQALANAGQHVPRAAEILGLSKAAMYRRLDKYGITY